MTDEAELSAFLDGELGPQRADEIAQRIAADPQLRAQYERLRMLDAQMRQVADAVAFAPRVVLPQPSAKMAPWLAILVAALPCAWLAAKLLGTVAASLAINGLALVLLIAGLAAVVGADRSRLRV